MKYIINDEWQTTDLLQVLALDEETYLHVQKLAVVVAA